MDSLIEGAPACVHGWLDAGYGWEDIHESLPNGCNIAVCHVEKRQAASAEKLQATSRRKFTQGAQLWILR